MKSSLCLLLNQGYYSFAKEYTPAKEMATVTIDSDGGWWVDCGTNLRDEDDFSVLVLFLEMFQGPPSLR